MLLSSAWVAAPSLPDLCIKAMQRFSPSALTARKKISGDQWSIPEAAFQAEMYAALKSELIGSQICSEYSQDRTGRIDFWLPDEAWGIELLQNGTLDAIEDHTINRFQFDENLDLCGKYRRWGILKDFVIINFCFGAKHRDLRNTGKRDPNPFSPNMLITRRPQHGSRSIFKDLSSRLQRGVIFHEGIQGGSYTRVRYILLGGREAPPPRRWLLSRIK